MQKMNRHLLGKNLDVSSENRVSATVFTGRIDAGLITYLSSKECQK